MTDLVGGPVTERITEGRLREIEQRCARETARRTVPGENFAELQRLDVEDGREPFTTISKPAAILDLVAEIRRLRELLCSAEQFVVPSDAWCEGCSRTVIDAHGPDCPVAAIEAEVAAIRAETPSDYVPVTQP